MSRATKRKHVVRELLEERVQPAEGQSVVRVLGTPGNNLHEVETAEGTRFLASMPPRFRRHIWIKRGDFLLVDPILEGSKVKAEISLVLLPPHVRSLQRQGLWPEAFAPLERKNPQESDEQGLFVNTNRGGPLGTPGTALRTRGTALGTARRTRGTVRTALGTARRTTRTPRTALGTPGTARSAAAEDTRGTQRTRVTPGDNAGTEDTGDIGDRGDTGQGRDAPQ
ncbi:unnamed protein product [Coccothraustes coccothraustes]